MKLRSKRKAHAKPEVGLVARPVTALRQTCSAVQHRRTMFGICFSEQENSLLLIAG